MVDDGPIRLLVTPRGLRRLPGHDETYTDKGNGLGPVPYIIPWSNFVEVPF